jgi:L,D-peptidoglycan transpeptidase YkuD (ErfK/YbiS/YcfS/YnhG family)
MRDRSAWAAIVILAMLCGCSGVRERVATSPVPDEAQQVVLVITSGWDAPNGALRRFERDAMKWREVGDAFAVSVGRAGSGWGRGLHPEQSDGPHKREGDGRAPAGIFDVGTAFGYAASAMTALDYLALDADDWCIDVNDSPLYNRIVDSKQVGVAAIAGATEPMRRDLHLEGDQRYREGFVIEHNRERVSGGGSCIFAHLWKTPGAPTAGCTAMAADDLSLLLAWLDARRRPLFVLLPEHEYARLRVNWALP